MRIYSGQVVQPKLLSFLVVFYLSAVDKFVDSFLRRACLDSRNTMEFW